MATREQAFKKKWSILRRFTFQNAFSQQAGCPDLPLVHRFALEGILFPRKPLFVLEMWGNIINNALKEKERGGARRSSEISSRFECTRFAHPLWKLHANKRLPSCRVGELLGTPWICLAFLGGVSQTRPEGLWAGASGHPEDCGARQTCADADAVLGGFLVAARPPT